MDSLWTKVDLPSMDSLNLKPFNLRETHMTHIKLYLQTWMVESNREIYFAPYIDAYVFFLVIFYEVLLIISAKYLWLMVGIIGNYVSSFQDNARLYGFIYG